ncbi:MAG: CoA transferase, partial [Syntrophomonadaceae bacterium]|nr:CoA transferase [Syntrophomonadaceae bacterium]
GYYAFYNIYRTKDNRYISLAAVETKFWQEFCDKLELTQYIEFQRDLSLQGEIKAAIQAKFLEKTRDQWMEFFQGSDICITPVLSLEEMYNHPQVIYREMITRVTDYDSGQELTLAGIPIKLSATPGKMKLTFPKLGEHNTEILLSLGYNLEDIEKLKRNKVI